MNEPCIPISEFGTVLAAAPDDARRRHLEVCPRCRALARSYCQFLDPPPLPRQARAAQAEAELTRRFARAVAANGTATSRPSRWQHVMTRSRRPLWAAAASLAVISGILFVHELTLDLGPRVSPNSEILRGDADTRATLEVTAGPAAGSVRLTWIRPSEADASVVVLYDASLREIERRSLGGETTLGLDDRALVPAAAYAAVVFLREGDEIGHSTPRSLLP